MNMKDTGLLDQVLKPGRYIGCEHNAYYKKPGTDDLKVCLCFADIYDIGMSAFGIQILYSILNRQDNIVCDRAYLPFNDMRILMRENHTILSSLEQQIPLKEFDLLGFSISYEMNYTNLLEMLSLANIPLKSKDRDNSYPIVITGGGGLFNPEPISEFVDAVFIGEAEEAVLQIAQVIKSAKNNKPDKKRLLMNLSKIQGMYIPSLDSSTSVEKRYVSDLDNVFFPKKQLVPLIRTIHDRAHIEIMRGCPWGCRFCQAGHTYGPVRKRSKEKIIELAKDTIKRTGFEEISFLSLSTGTHSEIEEIMSELSHEFRSQGVGMSLPSLRIDENIEKFPKLLSYVKKTGLTLAIEAASQRLRAIIKKNIDLEYFKKCVREAKQSGWSRIKLYFMIGLPTETTDDLAELCKLVNEIAFMFARNRKKKKNLVVSISNFIPKPHTPFQWCAMESIDSLYDKQQYIKQNINLSRVKLDFHRPEISFIEALLSRGDRRIGAVLQEVHNRGAIMQGWDEFFDFKIWQDALNHLNIDPAKYINHQLDTAKPLPWDHIKFSKTKEFLLKEYESAFA